MTNIENNHLCQISLDDNQDSNFINRLSTILQKKLYLQDVREQLEIPSAEVVILPLKMPVILLVTERLEKNYSQGTPPSDPTDRWEITYMVCHACHCNSNISNSPRRPKEGSTLSCCYIKPTKANHQHL